MFVVVVLNKQIEKQIYSDEFISPDNENDWIRIRDVLRPHCIGEEGSARPDMARGSLG